MCMEKFGLFFIHADITRVKKITFVSSLYELDVCIKFI